jgi:7-alpha-hydroxysteroid dehydrogenase
VYGVNVVVSGYNLDDAKKTSKGINDNGGNSIAIDCDVAKDEALVNLVNETVREFGSIERS